jgi:hypothetical protein
VLSIIKINHKTFLVALISQKDSSGNANNVVIVTEEELLPQVVSTKECEIAVEEDDVNKQDADEGQANMHLRDDGAAHAEVGITESTEGTLEFVNSNPAEALLEPAPVTLMEKQMYNSVPPMRKGDTPSLSRTMGTEGKPYAAKACSDTVESVDAHDEASNEQNNANMAGQDYDDTPPAPPCSREETSFDKHMDTREVLEQTAARLELIPNEGDVSHVQVVSIYHCDFVCGCVAEGEGYE